MSDENDSIVENDEVGEEEEEEYSFHEYSITSSVASPLKWRTKNDIISYGK